MYTAGVATTAVLRKSGTFRSVHVYAARRKVRPSPLAPSCALGKSWWGRDGDSHALVSTSSPKNKCLASSGRKVDEEFQATAVHTRIAALPTRLPLSLQRLSFFISPPYWISAQLLLSSDQQHRLRPSVPKNSPYKQLSAGETPASPDDPAARRQASQTHLPFPWVQRVCRGAALESEREKMRKRKREVRDWRVRV